MKIHRLLIHLSPVLLLASCIKSSDLPDKVADLNVSVGIPVMNSTISLEDAVSKLDSNVHIETTDEGYYKWVFGPTPFDFPAASELIKLSDQNVTNLPTVTTTSLIPNFSYTVNIPVDFESGSDYLVGSTLKNIYLSSGLLDMDITSATLTKKVFLTVTALNLVNRVTTKPLKLEYVLLPNQATTNPLSFTDAVFQMNAKDSLKINVSYAIENTAGTSAGTLKLNKLTLSNLQWSRIEGKLGTLTIPVVSSDTLAISSLYLSTFKNFEGENGASSSSPEFYVENPSFTIESKNSFGFPLKVKIEPLKSKDNSNSLNRTVTIAPFILSKPTDPGLGNAATYATNINSIPGSTLQTLMEIAPTYISYGVQIITDASQTSLATDYILSDSKITTLNTLEVPLYGYLNNFKLVSDLDNPVSSDSSSSEKFTIESATIKLDYVNNIPLDSKLQAYFLDENSAKFDSLFAGAVDIAGAPISSSGVSTGSTTPSAIITSVISKARYELFKKQCKKIRFVVSFKSTDAPNKSVKFFPKDKLNLKLSVLANGIVKF